MHQDDLKEKDEFAVATRNYFLDKVTTSRGQKVVECGIDATFKILSCPYKKLSLFRVSKKIIVFNICKHSVNICRDSLDGRALN